MKEPPRRLGITVSGHHKGAAELCTNYRWTTIYDLATWLARQQLACLLAFELGRWPEEALGAGYEESVLLHLRQFGDVSSEQLPGSLLWRGDASSLSWPMW